ncbi:MAG: hypothetical protein QOE22_367 [Candidatus Parcubacteria bacterium]|jgi:2'-5' RNA ligase|nr:hypothetical protein [Candidatus Parcubacteria bacterium]
MQSSPYDVVLLPDETVARKAIVLSRELAQHGSHFTLDGVSYYPHVSLYMLQLREDDLQKALEKLSSLAERTRTVTATADQYHRSAGYLSVKYVKSGDFTRVQDDVIRELNPLRDGLRQKDKGRLATIEGAERDNILEYGYRSVGNEFFPHLTFTRFVSPDEPLPEALPPKEDFDGEYLQLGLLEMGDNGTCIRLLKAWELERD